MQQAQGLKREHLLHMLAHTQLTHLSLARCELRELPAALRTLGLLRRLDPSGNSLHGNLKPLDGLTALTALHMAGMYWKSRPAVLSNLTALEELVSAGGSDLTGSLRTAWAAVCCAAMLLCAAAGCCCGLGNCATGCHLPAGLLHAWQHVGGSLHSSRRQQSMRSAPSTLPSSGTWLQDLDYCRSISEGWQHLSTLTALRSLSLQDCRIGQLSIGTLAQLKLLNVVRG